MFTPLRAVLAEPEGKVLVVGAFTMIGVGTVAYSLLEGWSPLDALYFSVVTLATVGYGDLHPTTDIAKLFTVGYVLIGIGILATFASELTKHRRVATRIAEDLHVVAPPSGGASAPGDAPVAEPSAPGELSSGDGDQG